MLKYYNKNHQVLLKGDIILLSPSLIIILLFTQHEWKEKLDY